jgi:hypothetical protein
MNGQGRGIANKDQTDPYSGSSLVPMLVIGLVLTLAACSRRWRSADGSRHSGRCEASNHDMQLHIMVQRTRHHRWDPACMIASGFAEAPPLMPRVRRAGRLQFC